VRRARALGSIVTAVAAALIAVAVAAASADHPGSVYGSAAVNRAHARGAVAKLVTQLRPGPGTTRSARAPGGRLTFEPVKMATQNEVDAHAWFTTARSPAAVMRFVAAHLPPGTLRDMGGSAGGSGGFLERDWPLPGVPGVPTREVAVSTSPLPGGRTAVRLDAAAVWLTPRPAWERIPRGVTSVTFSGGADSPIGTPGRRSRPVTVTGARARQLAALVNQLERAQPAVVACPSGDGAQLELTFRGPGHATLARAVYANQGCATVSLQVGDRTGPLLMDATLGAVSRSVLNDIVSHHLVPPCRTSQLSLAASVSIPPGEDGSIAFTIANRSDELCTVGGAPRVGLRTASGRAVTTRQSIVHATVNRTPSLLFPGSGARFDASFESCSDGPPVQAARVRLPGGTGALVATMGLIHPCDGRISVSGVD
jgi:hypothetical protein